MSANIGAWLGAGGGLPADVEAQRAALAWRRIQDKPASVAFRTPAGAALDAQTVRIESDSAATPAESAAGLAPRRKAIVFGVRNHAALPDTNMAEGYRFVHGNDEYRIVDVIVTLGEVQGIAEAIG